ncbi:hypothetical protein LRR81_04840 [Metabacillus sp. GX 13764]|uniref:hypothetical protein n=1 Tax=Metabacillus kandeliae TaxID=2900151 RepID=UPI001E315B53|nr:hypothetical protein [Metabacillus kandeliae]MCD7033549.1 hypothetical protein [Metabacillus kandeliae]
MKPIFFRIIGLLFILQVPLWLGIVHPIFLMIIGAIGLLIVIFSKELSRRSMQSSKPAPDENDKK